MVHDLYQKRKATLRENERNHEKERLIYRRLDPHQYRPLQMGTLMLRTTRWQMLRTEQAKKKHRGQRQKTLSLPTV